MAQDKNETKKSIIMKRINRSVKIQGVECPIIREGDDVISIVTDELMTVVDNLGFSVKDQEDGTYYRLYNIKDNDVIGITESVVSRAAGQFVTVDEIAERVRRTFGEHPSLFVVNPIYSRNRFSLILRGIARGAKGGTIHFLLPGIDVVGNTSRMNPFTGVNMTSHYKQICVEEGCEFVINKDSWGLDSNVIYCGLHDYKGWFRKYGDHSHITLAQLCSDKSPDWGLLGTNKAGDERLKLFPSIAECERVCKGIKKNIKEKTGNDVVVCVYGDGCFKSPFLYDEIDEEIEGTSIWELADPTAMVYSTDWDLMNSTPNEIKLKNMIDSSVGDINDDAIKDAVVARHSGDSKATSGEMGTTPRRCRDILASMMDLVSGSGDRATPVVLVQNFF